MNILDAKLANMSRQRGATLIIGLIMLTMTTVALIASYNMSNTSSVIVHNLQAENMAVEAASSTLESAISTTRIVDAPGAVFLVGCSGVQNARCFDINGDSVDDITVSLTPDPFCIQFQIIQNFQLDVAVAEDQGCVLGAGTDLGTQGAVTQNSLCANSLWQVTAVASDILTSSNQTVAGNYAVRVPADSVASFCI